MFQKLFSPLAPINAATSLTDVARRGCGTFEVEDENRRGNERVTPQEPVFPALP